MLNRRHIRVKVLQALYAFHTMGDQASKPEMENQLDKNLNKLYELYLYLLLFVTELARFTERYDDESSTQYIPSAKDINHNARFYRGKLITVLMNSEKLVKELEKNLLIWDPENNDILRKVLLDMKNTQIYKEFLSSDMEADLYDLELMSYIIKHYPENFSMAEQHFEDKFINWYDDSRIAIQMAIKTFKHIITDPEEDFIIPLISDEKQTGDYSRKLFRHVIDEDEEFQKLIVAKVDKWEPTRLPVIDTIILKMGLAEFLYFNDIPVKVTINEYVELAKNYSTPNSRKFINGVLDNLRDELTLEGRIKKTGLGTIND